MHEDWTFSLLLNAIKNSVQVWCIVQSSPDIVCVCVFFLRLCPLATVLKDSGVASRNNRYQRFMWGSKSCYCITDYGRPRGPFGSENRVQHRVAIISVTGCTFVGISV